MTAHSPNLTPGTLLQEGKYKILEVLGKGGFGITYLAWHSLLETEVAIKELFLQSPEAFCTRHPENHTVIPHTDPGKFEEFREKFIAEARILARLKNIPGIVQVVDIFSENGTAYMVMDYVKGPSVRKYVEERGAFSPSEAVAFISRLLEGLEKVHEKGILHRDINPNNILVSPSGEPVLIDFGISREYEENAQLTQTAYRTLGYAAPEQAVPKARRGPYTDIYGVGATLYFMLSGQRPQTLDEAELESPLALRNLNPSVPEALEAVVQKAMSRRPDQRYPQARFMQEALKKALGGTASKTSITPATDEVTRLDVPKPAPDPPPPDSIPKKTSSENTVETPGVSFAKSRSRTWWWAAISAVAVAGAGASFFFYWFPKGKSSPREVADILQKAQGFLPRNEPDSAYFVALRGLEKFPGDTSLTRFLEQLEKDNFLLFLKKGLYDILVQSGDSLYNKGDYTRAKEKYQKALQESGHLHFSSENEQLQSKIRACDSLQNAALPPLKEILRAQKNEPPSDAFKNQLLGTHRLKFAVFSIKSCSAGSVEFWEEAGELRMEGNQLCQGETYNIRGKVKQLKPGKSFEVLGTTTYKGLQNAPCSNLGSFTFRRQGSVWTYKENKNPCGGAFDWVEIEF